MGKYKGSACKWLKAVYTVCVRDGHRRSKRRLTEECAMYFDRADEIGCRWNEGLKFPDPPR